MSNYVCIHDGCDRGRATGHALHRTSPKGELFEGVCTAHAPLYGIVPDSIAVAIEQNNLREGDVINFTAEGEF